MRAWRTYIPIVLVVGLAYWLVSRQQEGFQTTPTNASIADVRNLVTRIGTLLAALQAAPTPDQATIDGVTQQRDTYQALVTAGDDPTTLSYTDYETTLNDVEQLIQSLQGASTASSATTPAPTLATTQQIQQLLTVAQQYLALLQAAATPNTVAIQQTQQGIESINSMLSSGTILETADTVTAEIASFQSLIQGLTAPATGTTAVTPPTANPTANYVGVKIRGTLAKLYEASTAISTPDPVDKIYTLDAAKTVVWSAGDPAPTSTIGGEFAYISAPLSIDTSSIADMKALLTTEYGTHGITLLDLVFESGGQFVDSTGALIFPAASTAGSTAPAATSAAAALPPEAPASQSAKEPESNTGLYIGIGLGVAVVAIGIGAFIYMRRAKA
jgi:hypothetical protein